MVDSVGLFTKFGFTFRQFAEVLHISPALLVQIQKGKRSLHKKTILAFEHPLFLETRFQKFKRSLNIFYLISVNFSRVLSGT